MSYKTKLLENLNFHCCSPKFKLITKKQMFVHFEDSCVAQCKTDLFCVFEMVGYITSNIVNP